MMFFIVPIFLLCILNTTSAALKENDRLVYVKLGAVKTILYAGSCASFFSKELLVKVSENTPLIKVKLKGALTSNEVLELLPLAWIEQLTQSGTLEVKISGKPYELLLKGKDVSKVIADLKNEFIKKPNYLIVDEALLCKLEIIKKKFIEGTEVIAHGDKGISELEMLLDQFSIK